jgi:hypothetical protein
MAKIFGGSASRLEVYALFAAAVVLIGGGISGAIIVTSSDSKPAAVAQPPVDTTVVDTSVAPTTAPPVATTPVTTSPPAAPPRPSPAPTIDYAQQYLNLSQPYRDKSAQVSNMGASPNFYAAAKELGVVAQTFGNALLQASWPANAQQAVREQAEANFALASALSQIEFIEISVFGAATTKASTKAQVTRALLGLPAS